MKAIMENRTHQKTIFDLASASKADTTQFLAEAHSLFDHIRSLPLAQQVELSNAMKLMLHQMGPFANEPVDCVLWVPNDEVQSNDYNPNSVAPPEMELLRLSIEADGYTQPIVSWKREGVYEVVDGFHRNRVGKECESVRERVKSYLPIVVIQGEREDRGDRIAATIRHNRARGKHKIDAMSEIVMELKRRNWSDEKIGRELGMDADEVLRLAQITGLAEMFADRDFSEAWEADDPNEINADDNLELESEVAPNDDDQASL